MPTSAIQQYLDRLPDDRRDAVKQLYRTVRENLPHGFQENFGMGITFDVPKSTYPAGYHCNPGQPLPFLCIANQKGHIALYHMGVYAHPGLFAWFTAEYPKHSKTKLDMGKSCIRFKKPDAIPYTLIGALCSKMSVEEWITIYETHIKR